ncbi:MAG: hydroxymethylglutaryl-CoA lyase [Chryseosolibacter sp.]
MSSVKIIECPRDAMQGIPEFIPTSRKVEYINKLLKVGFDTIDFGSFVSAKAIPQMADTVQVLEQLDLTESHSRLLAIVANTRGADEASHHAALTYLGFPLSISETFQKRNTNKSIAEALNSLEEIKNICDRKGKKLVTYISMGFGNPYGDPYEVDLVAQFVDILITLGSDVISLADTIGVADTAATESLFSSISRQFPQAELGVHLHSTPSASRAKVQAAYRGGCRRFDGALRGYGGCPMAKDELVGNIATETIISYFDAAGVSIPIDKEKFFEALAFADKVFATGQ